MKIQEVFKKVYFIIVLSTLMLLFQNCNSLESDNSINSSVNQDNQAPSNREEPNVTTKKRLGLGINTGVFAEQKLIDKLGDIGSWYYNYSPSPNRESYNTIKWANDFNKEFVPMIHGKSYLFANSGERCALISDFKESGSGQEVCDANDMAQNLIKMKQGFTSRNQPQNLITFNEPYKKVVTRSNTGEYAISPINAAKAFGKIISAAQKANLKIVSPSSSTEESAITWMSEFLKRCYDRRSYAANPCLVEKIALFNTHEYNCTSDFWINAYAKRGFKKALIQKLGSYKGYDWTSYVNNRKIWVTETNCNWESDFAKAQKENKFIRNPRETCLRATGQKAGHGKGSLYELQNMPNEIERFAWWNLYANPYKDSDLPNGINSSSINRITAVRMFDENLERTVTGDAYYEAYKGSNDLKSVDCSPRSPFVEKVTGLFKAQTGLVFFGFQDFYCRYDSLNQVHETYGSEWGRLLKSVRTVPSEMEHVGKCGQQQGLRKQQNEFYYTFKKGYTCWIDNKALLKDEAGFTLAESRLLKESNMSSLGLNAKANPGFSCFK